MRSAWLAVLGLTVAGTAAALPALNKEALRKTRTSDLAPPFERLVLPNGLTVLLSPEPTAASVVVDQSFFAGTTFEPPGKSGLAHLVEHLMSTGPGADTDYKALLESRGAAGFNALTTLDVMSFHVVVPPEELPLALWVAAERLARLPGSINEAELERNRRIVLRERAENIEDVAWGNAEAALFKVLFPPPHPLHGMVIGVPSELRSVTADEARAFATGHLAPANGTLTLVGRFDPAVAKEWLARTVGRLPRGVRVTPPSAPATGTRKDVTITVSEPRSRRPRVTLAWRLDAVLPELADTLAFGAQLLTIYTDGAFGIEVRAAFIEYSGGGVFQMNVTHSHDKLKRDTRDDAEGLLRYLTRASVTDDIFGAALLAWDRVVLMRIDNPAARAAMLTDFELRARGAASLAKHNERHWALLPWGIAPVARKALDDGRHTLHARPTNPRPRRPDRD